MSASFLYFSFPSEEEVILSSFPYDQFTNKLVNLLFFSAEVYSNTKGESNARFNW